MLSRKYSSYYKTTQTYYLSCKKHISVMGPKKVIMTNKVIREASKCTDCVAGKLKFFKKSKRLIREALGTRSILGFPYIKHSHYKTCCHAVWSAKVIQHTVDPKVLKTKN